MDVLSVALDLGSTGIKAARLRADGRLMPAGAEPAPPLSGRDPVREGDPVAYAEAARRVLAAACRGLPPDVAVGVASQRSSFLLWDAATGAPATPLISWQDRRAADWCVRHAEAAVEVAARTGLVLSPHYAGPKIAAMREADPQLARRLDAGELRFGTLDAWLLARWTDGRVFRTDGTMAARTALVDLDTGAWSPELCARFGVPPSALPTIHGSRFPGVPLPDGGRWIATLGDQGAGVLGVLGAGPDAERSALVNLGTGTFVLRPVADAQFRPAGYLIGPYLSGDRGESGARTDRTAVPTRFAIEGTINGGAAAVDALGPGPSELPAADPTPNALCLPDSAGLGAPHWRGDLGLRFSPDAERLDVAGRRRIALEGIVFRVVEILGDLCPKPPEHVVLSGGLAREPFVPAALAAALERPVAVSAETEGTLLGIARLAATGATETALSTESGKDPALRNRIRAPVPGGSGCYLAEKAGAWRAWRDGLLR